VEVVERETGGTAAANTGAAIFLWVVAGMAAALGLDPLSKLQLVSELQHGLLRGWSNGAIAGPSCGLGCESLGGSLLLGKFALYGGWFLRGPLGGHFLLRF
jgi:hypothetical protein